MRFRVAFGYFFANRVKEAANSLLFFFEDYQPQLFSTKRAADWTMKASSGSITWFTVNFQYGNIENESENKVCAHWRRSKTVLKVSLKTKYVHTGDEARRSN